MQTRGLVIENVENASIAAELNVQQGDTILQINGTNIKDIIDYKYFSAEEKLQVLVQKTHGEQWLLEIEKDYDEPLGLYFQNGGLGRTIRCRNKCIFCFVDQMPPRMRPTLYIKDDDYRLSFAQGNFITMTNTGPAELDRIVRLRLSPLYISVHTTNPELRPKIMGHPRAGHIMEQLQFLAQAGIEMHTQAVLCPGINDGNELERTIRELGALWPAVRSLAVVPVGLTSHRRGLYHLRPFRSDEAGAVIKMVHEWQDIFNANNDYPLVFASDEFYFTAGASVPTADRYGGFPQTENGVGLARLFLDQWNSARRQLPRATKTPLRFALVTGTLAGPLLRQVVDELNCIDGLETMLYVLKNNFFGHNVTVAGLLTGQDLITGLAGYDLGDKVFIPSVMLREGESTFLDDITVKGLSSRFGIPFIPVDGPKDLARELVR